MEKLKPIFISGREYDNNLLGFLNLTTDEQIAKKIYQATGDKVFKAFPIGWKTEYITKMKFAKQQIEAERKKPTAALMAYKVPSVSQAAHQYFLNNAEKIKGIIPDNLNLDPGAAFKALNPLLIVAGLAAAAVIIAQVAPLIPKARKAD